ncbi:hypothetical protein Ancab_017088, partial [Ancistrocladus abbreviatus]
YLRRYGPYDHRNFREEGNDSANRHIFVINKRIAIPKIGKPSMHITRLLAYVYSRDDFGYLCPLEA